MSKRPALDLVNPPRPDCVRTTYSKTKQGYGRCHVRRFGVIIHSAHRLAWIDHHGRPPAPGMYVCHTCDWPPCVNPEHLYEGTSAQNAQDRQARTPRTACLNGHEYLPGTFYLETYSLKGVVSRKCLTCRELKGLAGPIQRERALALVG